MGDTSYICKNELDKACFQHDMIYGDFKDLAKRIAADKVLRDKAFKIASDQKYDGYQRGLASMVYKFFYKKSQGSGRHSSSTLYRPSSSASRIANNKGNIRLADKLHKPIIRKFKKRKVYSSFSKYVWVIPLKDKKGVSIANGFEKVLNDSKRKTHKIWVNRGSEF